MSFLYKSKTAILNLLKSLLAAHMAKGKDFKVWDRQFIDTVVGHIQIGGVDMADQTLPRTHSMTCPTGWDTWRMMPK
jgi:hypothetical protein